jgi:hypothetical protein
MQIGGKARAILAQKRASSVWTIDSNASVIDAIGLMDEKNVGALPVVNNGTLVGIVSERDYTRKIILKEREGVALICWVNRRRRFASGMQPPVLRTVARPCRFFWSMFAIRSSSPSRRPHVFVPGIGQHFQHSAPQLAHLVSGRGAGGKLRPDAGHVGQGVHPEFLERGYLVKVFVHVIAHRGFLSGRGQSAANSRTVLSRCQRRGSF